MGELHKSIIEGARLLVCSDCAILGSMSWEVKKPRPGKLPAETQGRKPRSNKRPSRGQLSLEPTLELVEDFGARIRRRREARGLSHEELGREIGEKVSILKKLESYKISPDNRLAEKLQYALKTQLLVPATKGKLPKELLTRTPSKGVTLGYFVRRKKEPLEATGNESNHSTTTTSE